MEDVCTACLCSDRNLHFIGESGVYDIYSQILSEIPVYDLSQICVRVCWECRSALRRFQAFKDQVKTSYTELIRHFHQGDQSLMPPIKQPHLKSQENLIPPIKQPNLKSQEVISISYPEIKIEKDSLDLSNAEEEFGPAFGEHYEDSVLKEEEHCEPNAFVNDLMDNDLIDLEVEEKDAVKKVKTKVPKQLKKKGKLKKTAKIKKKKKKEKLKEILEKSDDSYHYNYDTVYDEQGENDEELNEGKNETYIEINILEKERKCDIYQSKNEFENETDANVIDKVPMDAMDPAEVPLAKASVPRSPRLPKGTASEKPTCAECGKVFSSRKTLRYHLNVLHKGNNRHPCPRCGKVYQWKSNLGRHMRSHKARDTGELYCATCDKRFASVATYRQHLSGSKQHVSENEFNYCCNDCGKKFVSKTRLRDHIDWEHLQKIKFRCQLCNKPFKCHTSLYVHMKNVHREKGLKDNLCHVCGKSYQNRAKLRYHIVAMHTTETPYHCAQCNAAFGWYSSLYRHVREVHYKVKLQPNRSKKSKKRLPDLIMHPPHIPLPFASQPPLHEHPGAVGHPGP